MTRIYCYYPWFEVNYLYYRGAAPCCYHRSCDNLCDPITEIWNGSFFREIRSRLVEGDIADTPCANCQARVLGWVDRIPDFRSRLKSTYERAVARYKEGAIELDYMPLVYYFGFPVTCNLDCIMCSQKSLRPERRRFPKNIIDDFFKNKYWAKAARIVLIGGEPLVERDCTNLIRSLAAQGSAASYDHLDINLLTNGTLLHRWMPILKAFPNISFGISIDSVQPEIYEKIRRGAKWHQLQNNIDALLKVGKTQNWSIGLSFVVMKSNLESLKESIRWARERDITSLSFVPITGHDNKEENIFIYNYLLDDVPSWRAYFDEAIDVAEKVGNQNAASDLNKLRMILEMAPWVSKEVEAKVLATNRWSRWDLERVFNDKCRRLNGLESEASVSKFLFPEK